MFGDPVNQGVPAPPLTRARVIEMLNNFADGQYQTISPDVCRVAASLLADSMPVAVHDCPGVVIRGKIMPFSHLFQPFNKGEAPRCVRCGLAESDYRTAPAKEAAAARSEPLSAERLDDLAMSLAYRVRIGSDYVENLPTATLLSVVTELISRRSSPVREGDLGQATPQTASHPSRATSKIADIIEVPHPSEFIREEMDERDWGTPTMARKMGGDYGVNRLAIEMYLSIGPTNEGLRLGDMATDIARAFGVSVEFVQNMEAAWLRYIDRRKETESAATHEMGAERSGASPSSADLSRGSDAPSPMTSEQRAEVLETIKFIRERADDRAPCLNLAMARLLNLADAASQMAQSNDYATPEAIAAAKRIDAKPYIYPRECVEVARALLARPSEPSGRGESGGIQGPSSDVVQNKEEQK